MRSILRVASIVLPLSLGIVSLSCAQPAGSGSQTPASPTAPPSSDVFANPSAFAGQTLQVEGTFEGYRVGDCRFAPRARSAALTRSDWIVRSGTQCLYVTGGTPAGFDSLDPASAGRRVSFRATVIDGGNGTYLLRMAE